MRDSKPIAKEAEHAKDAFGACRAEALAKAGSTCPFSSFGVHASACPNINSHPERFRRKGPTDRERGDEAVGVAGSGLGAASERGPAEGEDRPAIAAGDDNDVEMDGGPVKNGDMDSRGQPALHLKK